MKQLTPEYFALIEAVRKIDIQAAEYLENEAPKLLSFKPRNNIDGSFTWARTPQGNGYWSNLNSRIGYVKI